MVNAIFYQIIKSACRHFISPPSHLTGETGCFEKMSEFLQRFEKKEETDKERAKCVRSSYELLCWPQTRMVPLKSEVIRTVRFTGRGLRIVMMLMEPTSFSSQHVSYLSPALRGSLYLARAPLSASLRPLHGSTLKRRASQNGSPCKHGWLCLPFTLGEVRSSVSRFEQLRLGCELVTSWSE